MNTQSRKALSMLVVAALLAGASQAASAQDRGERATGVGPMIAAQGNAALLQIRNELRAGLEDALRPDLPVTPAPDQVGLSAPIAKPESVAL